MHLDASDLRIIKNAFNDVAAGPFGDYPVVDIGGRVLTVKDIASEVEHETPVGQIMLTQLDRAISSGAMTISQAVEKIKHPTPHAP